MVKILPGPLLDDMRLAEQRVKDMQGGDTELLQLCYEKLRAYQRESNGAYPGGPLIGPLMLRLEERLRVNAKD